jgi:hypothetical protein
VKHGGQRAKLTVAVKNKWFRAWTQTWFYRKVPLIQIPSPRQGKGIFALHSYMTRLDFVTEPSFHCPDDEAGDVTFVKATRTIGARDTVEEYMACGLFPLSASFNLGKIAKGETPMSKLSIPLSEFPIARRSKETNDGFRTRAELATMNVVGRYIRGDHKACVKTVSNRGWVNRIFEHASVPYGPRLEPDSEACEEAAKKRKSDVGVRPFGKCVKVSGQKAMPAKASMAPKGVSTAPSKIVPAKATHTMQALKAGVVTGTSVPPRATAPSGAVVSKITVTVAATVTASRDGVLQISTGAKRLDAALSSTVKGKHAKVDARPPPASVTLMLFRCNNQLR